MNIHLIHDEEKRKNQLFFSSSPCHFDMSDISKAYIVSGDTSFPTAPPPPPKSTEGPKLWMTPDLE